MNRLDKIKELNIINNELRFSSRLSECFYFNKDECNGKIKKAHSIQRTKLALLEEDVKKSKKIYSFVETTYNEKGKLVLKPIGKAEASIFHGFCDFHDNKLFSIIEDKEFDDENDQQIFIYSYRAFSFAHHRKIEQIKAFQKDTQFKDKIKKQLGSHQLNNLLKQTIIGYEEGEVIRERMNTIFKNESYDDLVCLIIDLPGFFPIACSSSMTPKFSPKTNTILNNNPNEKFEYIFFNIIPDLNGTKILISCFCDDEKSLLYIDELEKLSEFNMKKIVSGIMVGIIENTFISPYIYNKLSDSEKDNLMKELNETWIITTKEQKKHFKSSINFFNPKFIKK